MRRPVDKLRVVLLDLAFVILDSASTSVSFKVLRGRMWDCYSRIVPVDVETSIGLDFNRILAWFSGRRVRFMNAPEPLYLDFNELFRHSL